jgi:hypothetical protein
LPTADDTCPACRKHKFDPNVPDIAVRPAVVAASKSEREESLWRGATAFWFLQWAVAATLLLSVANTFLYEWSPSGGGLTYSLFRLILALAAFLCAIGALVAAFRVATWLRWGAPVVWAILAAVPYVGVVVLVALSRAALAEFREQGIPMRLFGPRIPRRPEPASGIAE